MNPRGVTRGILCYQAGRGPCPSREEFPGVASGTKRVAFSILLKVRMLKAADSQEGPLFTDSSKRQANSPSIAVIFPSPQCRTESPGCFPHLLCCQKANSVPWDLLLLCSVSNLVSHCFIVFRWSGSRWLAMPSTTPAKRFWPCIFIPPSSISSRHLIWDSVKPPWVFESPYLY